MFNRVFTRSFASSLKTAASKGTVPPPVRLFGVEGTYATALYQAAAKNSSIDAAFQSLQKVESTVKKDPKLSHLLQNPALSLNVETLLSRPSWKLTRIWMGTLSTC